MIHSLQRGQCYYVTEVDGTLCHHDRCRFSSARSTAYVITFRTYRDKYVYVNILSTKIISDMPHMQGKEGEAARLKKVTNFPSDLVTCGTYGGKNDAHRVWVEKC